MNRAWTSRLFASVVIALLLAAAMPTTASAQEIDDAEAALINGRNLVAGEAPHLVALIIVPNNANPQFTCSGSLIAPSVVLTAAHCTPADAQIEVGLGDVNIRDRRATEWIFAVPDRWTLPGYVDGSTPERDLALLLLEKPADISHPNIGLIALNTDRAKPAMDSLAIAQGHGVILPGETSVFPTVGQTVKMRRFAIGNAACASLLICVARASGGTCRGDSGGPLINPDDGTLAGVLSIGNDFLCEDPNRSEYASVARNIDWIRDITGPFLAVCNGKPVEWWVQSGVPFFGTPGPDVILGTAGDDIINSGSGSDTICARGGRDLIDAGSGDDVVYGGDGIDRIWGRNGDDRIYGEGGSDRIWGNDGNDQVFAGSGSDRVFGGAGDDILNGMGGQDSIWGDSGNDTIQGNFQSDRLYGGTGHDKIYGAGGKDRLFGEGGNDQLFGGDNTDWLHGGPGIDVANGGKGKDNPRVTNVSGCVAETRISC